MNCLQFRLHKIGSSSCCRDQLAIVPVAENGPGSNCRNRPVVDEKNLLWFLVQ